MSSRLSSGLAANIKGRNFEDEVADLYRLQGAHVQQNIEVCNKKVDVLATFTHPVRHRVIVECKDEKRAVDATRRVREFYGLLTAARKTNEADSAEIITRAPWGDAAKGFANETGVSLFTYIEKIRTLIDFTHYLKALIDRFEYYNPAMPGEPALGKYYIDLSAEREVEGRLEKLPVIDTYVHEWLDDTENDSTNLAIFGEYGAGKSSFCSKLAADLAAAFLYSPSAARIPILLNLRDFVGKLDIEAYVTSFLDRECSVPNPKIKTFTRMAEAGIFLLIFDGFDEMAVQDIDKAGKRDMDWSDKELLLSLQKKHEVRSNSLGTQIFEMGDALDDEFAATMLVLEAGDLRTLDVLRDYCSTMITGDVAIYWDEIETLFSKHPKAKGVFNRLVEDAASRTRELMSPKDRPDDGLN